MSGRSWTQRFVWCLLWIGLGSSEDILDYVDPFIGTGGEGFGIGSTPPGAQRPFGLVRLSPDTVAFDNIFIPWNHFGGYYHGDGHIRIFSHTHMVGSGVLDYGNIGFMPFTSIPTSDDITNYGFRSSFSHENEEARPGYYKVLLDDPQVTVELTSTMNTGWHRYTYLSHSPNQQDMFLLMDICHGLHDGSCGNASISIDAENGRAEGWILNQGGLSARFGGVQTYFAVQFNVAMTSYGTWNSGNVNPNSGFQVGTDIGAFVGFSPKSPVIEFSVGISCVSQEQAWLNLQVESSGKTFESTLTESSDIWRSELGAIQVEGGSRDQKIKFYTALYHTLLAPTTFSETGGIYRGFDLQLHKLSQDSKGYYSDMSIWDVHRTEFPWLAFFKPDVMSDIVKSLLLMKEQGGDIPRWPLAYGYTGCMDGQHADIIIADAFFKGIEFDIKMAYDAMKIAATTERKNAGREFIQDWLHLGYIPFDKDTKGACKTLAYCYDDWAIANVAKALNLTEDHNMFLNRSQNYKNVWNSEYQFFCPKTSSGEWECPPLWTDVFDERYTEGDAWHYRWWVPGDIEGLKKLFVSNDNFNQQLEELFHRSEFFPETVLPNPYYWAGNEPDILSVWLFALAGRPDLTQYYSRYVMNYWYTTESSGIPGNDDYGTMSAWYIWSAIGIYPISGSTTYVLGSPIFDRVTINTSSGRQLTITTSNNGPENYYVQNITLNGDPFNGWTIDHSQLEGVIQFDMRP
eukprot:TRINITY_DN3269_c0_g2_i4.p1 TRINITY_DN3269_c0_g2~~TRINITY_DN3269_c0_g2_i4.p1  ORF type:complete len:741 (+),score=200.96 TRINITY_DN3269_c0_g2_i4:19-2241(+)